MGMRFKMAKFLFIERSSSFRAFISLVISMLEKEALEGGELGELAADFVDFHLLHHQMVQCGRDHSE